MKDIVAYSRTVVAEATSLNKLGPRDWVTLTGAATTTSEWATDFAAIYERTIAGCPQARRVVQEANASDHGASFSVWYQRLVSGDSSEVFWADTALIGLYHASASVQNEHVIVMAGVIQEEFLRRSLKAFGPDEGAVVYTSFKRVFDTAISVMVGSYIEALMLGMAGVGINQRLVGQIRRVAIKKMIDEARAGLPLIEWTDALSVGVKRLDDQHKQLVNLLNALHDANTSGGDSEDMRRILGELVAYTIKHFKDEELLLEQTGYPATESHKKAHVALAEKVRVLNDEFQAGNTTLTAEVFKFLRTWLNGHIRGTDRSYTKHLLANGIESGYE